MKFLFAPDSFKGSLSSMELIDKLSTAALRYFDCEIIKVPIADGGEGTVDALTTACGGIKKTVTVTGPEFDSIQACYGVINGDTAVIEMATASGLTLLKKDKNPLYTTSYGTGELLLAAMQDGYRKIIIGIGGSATNDGGMGALQALGIRFYDSCGNIIQDGCGRKLIEIAHADASLLTPLADKCSIRVMCDVTNPLLGENGATYVFGPQKGASGQILVELEKGMQNYAARTQEYLCTTKVSEASAFSVIPSNADLSCEKGAGAAGGLGFGLMSYLNAKLAPGIDTILELVSFEELLSGVDMVITGEGSMDSQSLYGKAPVGIAKICKKHNIPVIAVVGGMNKGAEAVYEHGISAVYPVLPHAMPISDAINNTDEIFDGAADRLFRLIKALR